tara:strand:+ start:470 stop:601 length:132 start_codon:yes stop_codon:yes gene_type:complete
MVDRELERWTESEEGHRQLAEEGGGVVQVARGKLASKDMLFTL